MADDLNAWAAALGLPPEQETEFARLATSMGLDAAGVLRAMGLRGISHWASGREAAGVAADHGVAGLPLDIRPSGFMWPDDVPFPWSAEECRAAVIGYEVKWRGEFDDFLHRLRGLWEMSDGYAFLHQT